MILDNSYNIYDGTYKYVATVCGEDLSFTENEGDIYYSYQKLDNEEIYEDKEVSDLYVSGDSRLDLSTERNNGCY